MIKKLSILIVALLTVVSTQAQDNADQPRHEIGVTYGLGVSLIGDGIGNSLVLGIFDSMAGREWTNDKQFGTLGVEYYYHLPDEPRVALGGIFTYAQYGQDIEYKGVKEGERKRTYMTLMPSIKYYYVNSKSFGLYSKAALGAMLVNVKADDNTQNKSESNSDVRFMFQASLLGLEVGSQNVRAFVELGAGEQGIFLGGLRVKF